MASSPCQTAVVVGSARGIGLGICKALSADGWGVTAACRSSSAELQSVGCQVVEGVTLDEEGCGRLAAAVDTQVGLLVVAAGVLEVDEWPHLNYDSIRHQFEVNAVGPLRVVDALHSRLTSGSKVVVVTSKMGSFGSHTEGGMYGYRMSKAAANMVVKNLSVDLRPRGIAVAAFHPGAVLTEMYFSYHANRGSAGEGPNPAGARTVEQCVTSLLKVINGLSMESSGSFLTHEGVTLPW